MKSVFLIACSKEKGARKAPAKDFYLSDRFRLSRSAAEGYADKWFIVSAKHGLVPPERILSPYDVSLAEMNAKELDAWNRKVHAQLERLLPRDSHIVCIGNPEYFTPLASWDSKKKASVFIPFRWIDRSHQLAWLHKIQPDSKIAQDVARLYKLLSNPELETSHLRRFGDSTSSAQWPKRGLYIFFDPRHPRMLFPTNAKIIRVGTHAVSKGSASSLWQRLRNHKGQGDGRGNHRGSIFRLHIGGALMAMLAIECPSWGVGMSAVGEIREQESALERNVSEYLSNMQVVALDINDEPSKMSDRAYIEQNMIALLSGTAAPVEVADESWLGYYCPHRAVRRASLWNVDYTELEYDAAFLDVVEKYIAVSIGKAAPPNVPLAPQSWYLRSKSGYRQPGLDLS